MEKTIAHLYIPSFSLAVERLYRPELRGRPVAMVTSYSSKARITCLSTEAKREGISKGMFLSQATKICPHIITSVADPPLLAKVEGSIIRKALQYTPIWECSGPGKFYLDITGTKRLLGSGLDVAHSLNRQIRKDLNISGSVAVAGNKLVSAVASKVRGSGTIYEVKHGQESAFMAPLPVSFLPGIHFRQTHSLLKDLNITIIRDVVDLGMSNLRLIFGPYAGVIYRHALGIGSTCVYPGRHTMMTDVIRHMETDLMPNDHSPHQGMAPLTEEMILDEHENNDQRLLTIIYSAVERACLRLRKSTLAARSISLTIRYSDWAEKGGKLTLVRPSFWEFDLYPPAKRLFSKVYRRRVCLRSIKISFQDLCPPPRQLSLFSHEGNPLNKKIKLIQALDEIRDRFGDKTITFGHTVQK